MLFDLLILIGLLALGFLGLSLLMGELLTRPAVKPIEALPSDFGLPFEPVAFQSRDAIALPGWMIGPELPGPPVIILHGYTDRKSSYLDHARFLYEHGHPSVVYDQRGHGESATGRVSLGPLEARDLVAALEMLRETGRGDRFVLWGSSMGAAVGLLAASETVLVAGVISESSYETLEDVVADTLRIRYRVPRFPLVPAGLRIASLLAGVDLRDVSVARAVASLETPILFVSGECDPRMTPVVGERLFSLASKGLGHIVVSGADHAECWALGQPKYGENVLELIRYSLSGSGSVESRDRAATRVKRRILERI
jgi:pimeloyl-ACP methyl ester carboxylesterase